MLFRRAVSTAVNSPLSISSPPLSSPNLRFVPVHSLTQPDQSENLKKFILTKQKLLCITGAGISTESGIPDYRGEGVGLYATSKTRPMQYQDFIQSAAFRQRYWARNYLGYPFFSSLEPNITHKFTAMLENQNGLLWLITQNVDGLHWKAGSRRVTELHGTAFQVVCMSCSHTVPRDEYQSELREMNPDFNQDNLVIRPDADVELSETMVKSFRVAACKKCEHGVMKPDIVYFGENVPKTRVDFVYEKVAECDGLLILGSSMQVFSGYRFAARAAELKRPIAIVSIGQTRADHLATLRIDNVRCGDILSRIQTQ